MQREQRKEHELGIIKGIKKNASGGPRNRQQQSCGDLKKGRAKTSMYSKSKCIWSR
jgi:hypothetical protein